MGGFLILFVAALYIFTVYWIAKKIKSRWGKIIATILLVLIPTVDAIYGRLKLKQLCGTEGGLHVFHTVSNAKGIFQKNEPREDWIVKYGFDFIEGEYMKNGHVENLRLVKTDQNRVTKLFNLPLISEYEIRLQNQPDIQKNYEHTKYATWIRKDIYIENRNTHEILGRITDFNYAGGWIERLISEMYASRGDAGSCNIAKNSWEYSQLDSKLLSEIFIHDLKRDFK